MRAPKPLRHADADAGAVTDADADAGAGTDADADADAGAVTDADAGTDADADADAGAVTDADAGTDADAVTDADAGTRQRSPRTARRTDGPLTLLLRAAGGPAAVAGKTRRLASALAAYADSAEIDRRLEQLRRAGVVARVPSRVQLVVGALDMLRFWISPAAADYYRRQGISYGFHQLLRFLDEPASLTDPIGLLSTRDAIVGHLMQVVHANPVYDLELLSMFEDGLDELEQQLVQMMDGTHPRAGSIGAIVEEPDYHARLLEFARAWRVDPAAAPPLRDNVAASTTFSELDKTFGSLHAAMGYFVRLPDTPMAALRHLLFVRAFPSQLAT